MQSLKELRIELGLTQDQVAERAAATGRFRKGLSRHNVLYAERGIGLGSTETIDALAVGFGLSLAQLRSYLRGELSVSQAVAASSIRPDLNEVKRLREADAKRDLRRESDERLPNLRATLDWCRGQFPEEFLANVTRRFVHRTTDLERAEWFEMIKARFYDWREHHSMQNDESADQPAEQRAPERQKKVKGARS